MEILYLLIAVTVLLVASVAVVMLWAVRSGQYEDLEGPAWRVLADDDGIKTQSKDRDPDQSRPD